jgi:hypothetical protein
LHITAIEYSTSCFTPSKKKTKAKKQKNTAKAASGSRQAEGRKKSCIPGVEYIHILFIYIVVRNDAKDATTTTTIAAAMAAAAAAEGNNSCSKLWRQEQNWLTVLDKSKLPWKIEEDEEEEERESIALVLWFGYQKFRVCGNCMPLSPSKLCLFLINFYFHANFMFPLKFVNLGGSKLFLFSCQFLCSFQICQFLGGLYCYFYFHANYVPFKLVIIWGVKTFFFFHANYVSFKFCHFWGINFSFHANYVPPFLGIRFSFEANYIPSQLPLF